MKLPQASLLRKIIDRLGHLSPFLKRMLVLGALTLTCFILVLPFIRHSAPQTSNAPVQPLSVSSSKTTPETIVEQETSGDVKAEPERVGKTEPKKATSLSEKDFRSPLKGTALRGGGKDLIWWEVLGDYRVHPGTDIKAPVGTKVLAAAPGKVVEIGTDPVFGKVIVLDHGNDWITVYGQLDNVKVKLHSMLAQGQELAQVGRPTGGEADLEPHLHYELRQAMKVVN